MQNISKTNDIGGSVTGNLSSRKLTMPKLLGLSTFILSVGLMTAGSVRAEQSTAMTLAAKSELENTERNVRDKDNKTLTPQKQKATRGDLKITTAIRKAIVKQKSLSVDAHNAKIITRNGVVTLRGPVENTAEKTELQAIAEKVKGVTQVDNQLEPKTP
jgi:hyperosmotically inducible protein